MEAIESKPELYSIAVFRYDYETGLTTCCNYFRNPFHGDDSAWKGTETSPQQPLNFFPSITRLTAWYV